MQNPPKEGLTPHRIMLNLASFVTFLIFLIVIRFSSLKSIVLSFILLLVISGRSS